MGLLNFFRKKGSIGLPPSMDVSGPEKPNFPEQPLSFGIREESSDKLELIRTKLDLLNAKLDNIDRKIEELERLAER